MMLNRAFDVVVALLGLLILLPILAAIAIFVRLSSPGPILFRQTRVGFGGKAFVLLKFRTMTVRSGSEKGAFDAGDTSRVTRVGRFLRATKLDELPQLWNIIRGDMALVGPRPEVRKWVEVNPERWAIVHAVRPGITDPAAILYRDEEKILANVPDPERLYREEILPQKLDLYEEYVRTRSLLEDLIILGRTALALVGMATPPQRSIGGNMLTQGFGSTAPPLRLDDVGRTIAIEPAMTALQRPRALLKRIPYSRVSCGGNELAYVKEVLESGWLTTASKAQALEQRFAAAVGSRFACAVNSCTSALHLGLEAVGVQAGDKVLVPTMTFTATAEVVRYLGADPVFLDVEYGSSLVTPEILRDALDRYPDVRALIVVHFAGQPAQMLDEDGAPGLLEICRRRGVRVLEDAAHAFPTRCGDRMVGALGDATCFSFYANKTITTGEGGMLTTDDPAIAARARVMRLHGIDRDVWDRFTAAKPAWEYDVIAPGYKYNMPDVNAAIGLAQLERAHIMRDRRQQIAARYAQRLAGHEDLDLPLVRVPPKDHAWHLFVVVVKPTARLGRDRLVELLAERGIGTSVTYKPLHRMTYYRDRYGLDAADFPSAERIWKGCLALPIYPSLEDEEVDHVCDTLLDLLG